MSSALIPSYTGVLEDLHITKLGQILQLPIASNQVQVAYGGMLASEPVSFVTARDALFDLIITQQANVQVESQVLELITQWDSLPLHDKEIDLPTIRREIKERLLIIYPVVTTTNTHFPMGR